MTSQDFNPQKKKYTKSNYVEVLEILTPEVYMAEDLALSGPGINPVSQLINSHIRACNNISSIIYVSSLPKVPHLSAMHNISGFAPYFVKQNRLSRLTPTQFEDKILFPLGRSLKDFETSAAFKSYLEDSLFSSISLNTPTTTFTGQDDSNSSSTHKYLIDNLNWIYFLNTSGRDIGVDGAAGFNLNPSTIAIHLLVSKTYRGLTLETNDFVKAFQEFVWENYETCAAFSGIDILPGEYSTSTNISSVSSSYTSGTQQLDKIKTLIDVVYSPHHTDRHDEKVVGAIDNYLSLSTTLTDETPRGPFYNLLRAFSYSFADINNDIGTIETLNDIEQCPDEYLELLADLIGWKLFGSDPSRWRLQLINAVEVYKRAGTKNSIQFALDSLFAKDAFSLSSNIYEMWESYIPNLMLYAIATESSSFSNFENYKVTKKAMGNAWPWVMKDKDNSMEQNMRLAVDHIMLTLVSGYPDHFSIGQEPFPLGAKDFTFNYRGRNFPIPPWEEMSYYMNSEVTESIVKKIVDQLACYGVRAAFALEVGDYIRDNSLRAGLTSSSTATDNIREGNKWLMFTSEASVPPNWNTVLKDISTNREEFLSLWSGKSSHFKVILSANDFDFTKKNLDIDSKDALFGAIRILKEFSPAHSIPDVKLIVSEDNEFNTSRLDDKSYIGLGNQETYNLSSDTTVPGIGMIAGGLARYTTCGLSMNGWRRPGTWANLSPFSREDVNSISDGLINASATYVADVPRNALRRRDFKYSLPTEGLYDRGGFNSPQFWNSNPSSHTLETSYTSSLGELPLGLIPSSGKFHGIHDYKNIPDVYSMCQTRDNVLSSFSGAPVSATYPCRGASSWADLRDSSGTYYVDRGQLDPFLAVIHSMEERKKILLAQAIIEDNVSGYSSEFDWRNVSGSYANSSTVSGNWFPSGSKDLERYGFGRGIHKLYNDYTRTFNRHRLRPDIWDLEGPTIFAHTFGSILRNSSFDKYGAAYSNFPVVVASSIATVSAHALASPSGVFNPNEFTAYGTYIASTTAEAVVSGVHSPSTVELRNANIVSGMEFIHTSAPGSILTENSFTVFNIDPSYKKEEEENFAINNPLIKMKCVGNGLSRIKFDMKTYVNPLGELYPRTDNLLVPDHEFEIKINSLSCDEEGSRLGEAMFGAWIHTAPENDYIWSWMPFDSTTRSGERWVRHHVSEITKSFVLDTLAHNLTYEHKERDIRDPSDPDKGQCIDFNSPENPNENIPLILSFKKKEFEKHSIKFNTLNSLIRIPGDYHKKSGLLHRQDQNYVFEFFMRPDNIMPPRFILMDNINLVDTTYRKWASLQVSGDLRTALNKYEVTEIFKHFNNIAGANFRTNFATRVAANSASSMVGGFTTSGGSRANYRVHPSLFGDAKELTTGNYENLEFVN